MATAAGQSAGVTPANAAPLTALAPVSFPQGGLSALSRRFQGNRNKNLSSLRRNLSARGSGSSPNWLPGVSAQSALLWDEIPIRIATGRWNHKRIIMEVLA